MLLFEISTCSRVFWKKNKDPMTDLLLSGQEAQSESEQAYKTSLSLPLRLIPSPQVALT